jgi:hypothetical protein
MRHDLSILSLSLRRNAALRRRGGSLTVPAAMAFHYLQAAYQAAPIICLSNRRRAKKS